MHLSCRARAYLAKQSAESFSDTAGKICNLIVVGHAEGKSGRFEIEPGNELLIVPALDSYEGLSQKCAAAYHFLALAGWLSPVLKVDDDIRCPNTTRLLDDIVPTIHARGYLGKVWHAHLGFSRTWHLGKCETEELNNRPYSFLANASYAEGPAYGLGSRALNVLGKAFIGLESHFDVEGGYEDLAIGKVLNHYNIMPLNYDFIQHGALTSTDAWMMERAGLKVSGLIGAYVTRLVATGDAPRVGHSVPKICTDLCHREEISAHEIRNKD